MSTIYEYGDIKIHNGSCLDVMKTFPNGEIDLILTSPPYNTSKQAGVLKEGVVDKNLRYDVYVDKQTNDEYCQFTKDLFVEFDRILKPNGCVLYNISYGAENSECMFRAVNEVLVSTPFTIADVIVWKKRSATPNNGSSNKLTRLCEFVFVFCRRSEYYTFYSNKRAKTLKSTGQAYYENIYNFVEAKNNDESCPYNNATYSTELCNKLLKIYAPDEALVYDPFMGSGTTAVACDRLGLRCWGSELSENQCKWAIDRLKRQDTGMELNFDDCE